MILLSLNYTVLCIFAISANVKKCYQNISWLQLLVYKLFIFKFDYKAPNLLFYRIQAYIKVLQIKVIPFEKCLSMMTVA